MLKIICNEFIHSYPLNCRRIAMLEAAGAAFQSGAGNIESAYLGQGGYSSSKKFRV